MPNCSQHWGQYGWEARPFTGGVAPSPNFSPLQPPLRSSVYSDDNTTSSQSGVARGTTSTWRPSFGRWDVYTQCTSLSLAGGRVPRVGFVGAAYTTLLLGVDRWLLQLALVSAPDY